MLNVLKLKYTNLVSDTRFSEILSGSAWAFGARVIATGVAMITSIVVARVYGPEIMGVVTMINSFLTLSTIFAALGTDVAILRLIPEHIAKYSPNSAYKVYRKTMHLVVGVSVVTGCVFLFCSSLIADKIFSKPHLSFIFACAAVFLVFRSLMDLNIRAVRGLRLVRTFAFMHLLPTLSKLLILIGITVFFFDPINPVYALFASIIITALTGAIFLHFEFKKVKQPSDVVLDMPVKNILTFSLPMLMTNAMTFVSLQVGIIFLGMFRTEAEVGYYDVAVKLATLTTFVLHSVGVIAAPKFSELFHGGNKEELFYIVKKSAKLIFWTTVPILIGLIVLGKAIIWLLFGPDFIVAYGAMVLLVVGQFVSCISGPTGIFMNMTGHQNVFRNIIFGAAVINAILSLTLIPPFGIIGAAFAGMFSLAFWNICVLLYIKSKHGVIIGYLPSLF